MSFCGIMSRHDSYGGTMNGLLCCWVNELIVFERQNRCWSAILSDLFQTLTYLQRCPLRHEELQITEWYFCSKLQSFFGQGF